MVARDVKVLFEETGEEREVRSWCRRCFKTEPEPEEITIVSPRCMGHDANETGEQTHCGIPATDDGWWHRL